MRREKPPWVAVDVGQQAVTVTVTNPLPAGDTNLTAGMGRTSTCVPKSWVDMPRSGRQVQDEATSGRVHAVLPAAA